MGGKAAFEHQNFWPAYQTCVNARLAWGVSEGSSYVLQFAKLLKWNLFGGGKVDFSGSSRWVGGRVGEVSALQSGCVCVYHVCTLFGNMDIGVWCSLPVDSSYGWPGIHTSYCRFKRKRAWHRFIHAFAKGAGAGFILQAVPEQIAKGFWCKNLARKRCPQYGTDSSMDWCKLCCSLLQTKLLSF